MAFTPPGSPASGASPTLREIFTIPDHAGTSTFVLQLSDATTADELGSTLAEYVVTPSIADAFDDALALVDSALAEGENKGAFLKGSFGSGKSHFMAVLLALLTGNQQARAIPDLQESIARHPRATGSKILALPFHFLGSDSIEDTLFRSYLDQLNTLHPDTTPPVLHRAEGLLENAEAMRASVGDDKFFATLATAITGPDGATSSSSTSGGLDLAALGGTAARTWDAGAYDRARHPAADRTQRDNLISALGETWFTSARTNTDWLHLPDGLAAISEHAKGLGYEAVVLLLDELILWLTFHFSNREFFGREIQKLTGFIESGQGRMAVPVVSFIARQHDLKAWKDSSIEAGEAATIREKSIAHQEGRFASITLGSANLPQIAHRRLLTPKDAAAAAALQQSFERLHLSPAVKPVLLDKVNTDDQHRGSTEEDFRLTYPFSPVLIDTLIHLSSAMQRDRTALKVMENMLVDLADTMTIDQVIPVGEVFDYIIEGTQRGGADESVVARFRTARALWHDKLRPAVFDQFPDQDPSIPDLEQPRGVRARLRLAKTLLLSALAPEVPGLKALTASRLAHLNHGELTLVVPSDAASQVLQSVREWNTSVPEITVGTDTTDPLISITLEELPFDEILDRARGEDTVSRRRERLRTILAQELGIHETPQQQDGARNIQLTWRGTRRTVEIVFGNVRDPEAVPESLLVPVEPGALRVVVDIPFDDDGHGVAEDHQRLDRLRADGLNTFTLAWLPAFLDRKQMDDLGKLVTIDWVIQPEKWLGYTSYLAEGDRERVRQVMITQRDQLAGQLAAILRQKYGISGGETFPENQPPVRSLDTSVTVQRPVGASLGEAARRLFESAFDNKYPDHPRFDTTTALTQADYTRALEALRASDTHADGRANFDKSVRRSVALVLAGLRVANVYEAHLVFPSTEFTTFAGQIDRALAESPAGPDSEGTVTIGDITQVIDTLRPDAGLTRDSLILYAAAWAEARDRSWFHHNAPMAPPAFREIQQHHQLREPVMPDQAEWQQAVKAAQHLFGLPERGHLSPTNLTRLAAEVATYAADHTHASEDLVQELGRLNARLEIDGDTPRLALARRQTELLRSLATKKDRPTELVTTLAAAADSDTRYLGATSTEASRSITHAADVAAVARGIGATLTNLLAGRSREGILGAEAHTIVQALADGVAKHEFVAELGTVVTQFEKAAQAWLTKLVAHTPPVTTSDDPPPVTPDHPERPVIPDPTPPLVDQDVVIEGSGRQRHFSAGPSQIAGAIAAAVAELESTHGANVRYRVEIVVDEDQA